MNTYKAMIKIGPNRNSRQLVFIRAGDFWKARQLLAAQYGEGNFQDVVQVADDADRK